MKKELNETSTMMHNIQEYFCSVSEDSTNRAFLAPTAEKTKRQRIHSKSTIISDLHG